MSNAALARLNWLAGAVASVLLSAQAWALPINSPVPSSASIQFAGLDWPWDGPCAHLECAPGIGQGNLSYQATQELALLLANLPSFFVFPGANVPQLFMDLVSGARFLPGPPPGHAACALPYTLYVHCNWSNGVGGFWAAPGATGGSEQPDVGEEVAAVPEPSSLALLGAGLIGLGFLRRRRNAA